MVGKEQLQATIDEARRKLAKITDAEDAKKNRALVGKCFKYPKNCYSCPTKPSDYWPVYHKVTGLSPRYGGGVKAITFQTDSKGRIEIREDRWFLETAGCVPISEAEFQRAWKRVQRKIAKLNP